MLGKPSSQGGDGTAWDSKTAKAAKEKAAKVVDKAIKSKPTGKGK